MNNSIPFTPSRLDSTIYFEKNCKSFFKTKKAVIDIGCGQLYFYKLLVTMGTKGSYLGIDQAPANIQTAQSKLKAITYQIDLFNFTSKKRYDVAVCLWVLEHIKNDGAAIKKISTLLKKDAILILSVPSIWTWPFEFGRHGFHYYSKKNILTKLRESGFEVLAFYESAGLLGFIFMIVYNWPRFAILAPVLPIYQIMFSLKLTSKSWGRFSKDLISATWYRYHRSTYGIKLHNSIVKRIVSLDNKLKILPASYILVLKNEATKS